MGKKNRKKARDKVEEKIENTEETEALRKQGCYMCSNLHTPEYLRSMKFRQDHNRWDDIRDVMAVLNDKRWSWAANTDCKYLNLRVDMRDGGCLIEANSRRISPKQLRWQYSRETPNPVPDAEAYDDYQAPGERVKKMFSLKEDDIYSALREWVYDQTDSGYKASAEEIEEVEAIIATVRSLMDLARAAEPLVRRHRDWLKAQKNPDGSPRSCFVGDVLTENLIGKFKVLEDKGIIPQVNSSSLP